MADSGAWQRVNTQVPIRSPRYAVFDLSEGKQYKFRVLSANIHGNSEPSEPTGPIQTQELKGLLLSTLKLLLCFGLSMVISMIYCNFLYLYLKKTVFRCAICSRSSDFYQGNRHLCPYPVGSSKGTQQSDWVLHWPVREGIQGLDLSQSQTSQEHQVCFQPNKNTLYCWEMSLCLITHGFYMWFCPCRFVVSGLTKGETYVFRVQAINELGLSDESQESAPLTVKAALSQYYIFHY